VCFRLFLSIAQRILTPTGASPVGVRIVCAAKIKRERQKNAFLYPRASYHYNFITMALIAPRTRANERLTPSLCPEPDNEATTRKRTRFFAAYNQNCLKILFRELCRREKVKESTERYWRRQRESQGHLAIRSTRKVSKKLRRKSKVTKAIAQMLVNLTQNLVHN
jgi:hypothetical protein